MTRKQIRKIFTDAINSAEDHEIISKLQLCREYFSNPTFRKFLEDYTWELNNQ